MRGAVGLALGVVGVAAGCSLDPRATLRDADLHVAVVGIDARTTALEVRAVPETSDVEVLRRPATDGLDTLAVYLPSLPSGRYRIHLRAVGAEGEPVGCAVYPEPISVGAAPWDITVDMVTHVEACDALASDAGDAGADAIDAAGENDDRGGHGSDKDARVRDDGGPPGQGDPHRP